MSRNLAKGDKMKKGIIGWIVFVVAYIGFWNLIDLLYSKIITHTPYIFQTRMDLIMPLIAGIVLGYFLVFKNYQK